MNLTWIQYEISRLKLSGIIRLIKLVSLELTYIILYTCLDMTRTRHDTFMIDKFWHDLQTKHEPNTKLAG
jgi:hypothetical protein